MRRCGRSLPPNNIIELGKYGRNYFNKRVDPNGQVAYEFKTLEQFNAVRSRKARALARPVGPG